jgi:hypothetical protein
MALIINSRNAKIFITKYVEGLDVMYFELKTALASHFTS